MRANRLASAGFPSAWAQTNADTALTNYVRGGKSLVASWTEYETMCAAN
jgi:hypothetical protein